MALQVASSMGVLVTLLVKFPFPQISELLILPRLNVAYKTGEMEDENLR